MLAFSDETSIGKLGKMLQNLTRRVFVSDTIFAFIFHMLLCFQTSWFWRVLFSALFLHC